MLGELQIRDRAEIQRLAGELLQADPLISSEVPRFTAEKEAGTHLRHHPDRRADGGLLLGRAGSDHPRPFRLVDEIECRDRDVRNDLAIDRQPEFRTVASNYG